MCSSNHFSISSCFPCFSRSRFFRVQVFRVQGASPGYRSSPLDEFLRKGVLKTCSKFAGEQSRRRAIFTKQINKGAFSTMPNIYDGAFLPKQLTVFTKSFIIDAWQSSTYFSKQKLESAFTVTPQFIPCTVLVITFLGGQFGINYPRAFFKIFKNHEGDLFPKLPKLSWLLVSYVKLTNTLY